MFGVIKPNCGLIGSFFFFPPLVWTSVLIVPTLTAGVLDRKAHPLCGKHPDPAASPAHVHSRPESHVTSEAPFS